MGIAWEYCGRFVEEFCVRESLFRKQRVFRTPAKISSAHMSTKMRAGVRYGHFSTNPQQSLQQQGPKV
ncbi:MAG: hypothetical protein WAK48_15305, partial [Candidatus Acidiferrum sp.]